MTVTVHLIDQTRTAVVHARDRREALTLAAAFDPGFQQWSNPAGSDPAGPYEAWHERLSQHDPEGFGASSAVDSGGRRYRYVRAVSFLTAPAAKPSAVVSSGAAVRPPVRTSPAALS